MELELDFHSAFGVIDDYFEDERSTVLQIIERLVYIAPRLRFLTLANGWGDTIHDFEILSESLESLTLVDLEDMHVGPVIQDLDINCLALTNLEMRMALDVFSPDQFVRRQSYGVIEDMHITFEILLGNPREEYPMIEKYIFEMMGKMKSLKKLH